MVFVCLPEGIVFFGDGYKSSSYKWILLKNPMKTSSIYRRQKPACDIGHTFAPTNRELTNAMGTSLYLDGPWS